MTKVLLGLHFMASSALHLLCCGLPILISISGSLGIIMAIKPFTPFITGFQLLIFGFTFYRLYKPDNKARRNINKIRIVFWLISLISFVLFFYPPAHWFKSEEEKIKEAQMERFFRLNNNY